MYTISSDTHMKLREVLKYFKHTEVSGSIVDGNITIKRPFTHIVDMKSPITFMLDNGYDAMCGVELDFTDDVVFHTHPESCYTKNEAYLGIPSCFDMINIVRSYIEFNQKVHLVCAIEGTYAIRINREKINKTNWESVKTDINKIYCRIDRRSMFSNSYKKRVALIDKYVDAMNTTGYVRVTFHKDPSLITI